ncbi:questin oxidase family protein [Rhizobium sp. WYJ-E13]|uniref:questin oxidase family protein n=1 Tax=Rhizobium sp. WYJ-E13 TaxID=2849093 RepID=UPI001C1ECFF7|nr:questin oxidase family protein [Rhizobium sp. WYJ-E13]QWW71456.1 questin oxidase family protein [Rhizobium sp. WYJ-E13]
MSQATTAVQAGHLYRDEATGTRLRELIADVGRRSGEFPDDLANHLPMVLEAMARLGAPAARLEAYAEHYTRSHAVPMQPPLISALDDATWRSALGRREREGDLRRYFTARVSKEGGSATALAVMPVLAPGVAASATHGLMRLAYAFLRNDDAEVAAALGYWAATYLAYKGIPAERMPDTTDPLACLIDMRADPALRNLDAPTHLLWKWIEAMGKLSAFRDRLGRLVAGPDFLDRIRPASLALYAGTMSFEALHAVTGCHWLRLVSPHIGEPQRLALHFWEVVMALYTKIGMPLPPTSGELEEWRHLPLPSDAEIAAAAVASDDEHDHSLVFSAFEEYRYTGDRLYKVVAARRVGLIAG